MKQRYIKLLLIIILSSIVNLTFSQTSRGRVQIQEGTLVTDQGTLLRGGTDLSPYNGFVWEDIKEEITGIKDLGLNSLHLYAESADVFEPGERVAYVDSIVKWTREDSLYLIMTATWHKNYGTDLEPDMRPEIEFIREFWQFYAPRYKNETHMIYEICNEAFMWTSPYDSLTLAMEREMYDTIRFYAPETHIQFMSYGGVDNVDSVFVDISKLGSGIDWENASIAVHGYRVASENLRPFINTVQDSGYALTITEFHSLHNEYANMAYTRIFEDESISYLHFVSIEKMRNSPAHFKGKVESSEIRWPPDFGSWPESITNINYRDPYTWISAIFYDEGYGFDIPGLYATIINWISDNEYAAFYNLDFEDGPATFQAECASNLDGGNIEIHLDSLNGPIIGICPVTITGSWDQFETFSCDITASVEGVHKIYLVFKDTGQDGLFDLKRIIFKKSYENSVNSEVLENERICIYPNPARDFIKVNIKKSATIEIYNIQGNLLINKQLSVGYSIIPVRILSSGSYIIKIINSTEVYSEILIIE